MNIDIEINSKKYQTHKYYEWESKYTLMENINNGCITHQVKLEPADIVRIKQFQKEHY